MANIDRSRFDADPYTLSMREFRGKIRKCHDASMARSRVQSVLDNYNRMRLDMPKAIQLKVATFLRHEKWVDSPRTLSQFRLYHMLTGRGRTKVLNFSAWLIVAAIWPSHPLVLGIADDMSRFWEHKFPDTRPFFPKNVSEEEALLKYDGNPVQGDEDPLSDGDDGDPTDNNKGDNKRESNSGDILDRVTKRHKFDRTTALTNNGIPKLSNVQKTPGAEGPEQGRVSYLKRKLKARDELIKQQDAQIKKLVRRRDRRFKDGDKDFRRLFDRVEALKTNLKDAAEKEHGLQSHVRQLEDQIKHRDKEIERLSDRNRKLKAENKDLNRTSQTYAEGLEGVINLRGKETEELSYVNGTIEVKVKETSDTE
ncbi:hypothetical protein FANTH_4672 [Fusarium anthophilum]|uniref:Uncharacterized protein n=1 Tax=Fusarium anthophilum TaxID=48485 RepID=A0A8H5E7K9_9HYPO|nr:hypothetical protein FANTH_4672 [Fusarium anthophilum]